MADQRTYTGGRFALDIDGFNVGFLKKFSGLAMEADIVANDLGPDNVQKKHVANVKWTPAKATIGIGMGKGMYDWMKAAFDKGFITKNGTFTSADFNYKAQSALTFSNALMTEVTVPKLDGSSKDAAYFDIGFEAEQVRWAKGGGEDIRGKIGPKQKQWLCSNFKIEIGGLPCQRVATVDSFTWKCAVAADMLGVFCENTKHPAKVTVPDLKLSISYADHDAWSQAAKKWFIDGNRTEADEMTGRIVFLGPNMKEELGEITLENVGFKKFADEDAEANSEKIKRFNVELYVEKMTFKLAAFDA
jgi:T4-like virus tail tube protein gp19